MNKHTKIYLTIFLVLINFVIFTSLVFAQALENPLKVKDPRIIIGRVISAILGIVGSLALLMFILGGFTWVIAAGNQDKIKKGKDMVMWAALGLAVIFLSYILVRFIVEGLTTSSGPSPANIPVTGQSIPVTR